MERAVALTITLVDVLFLPFLLVGVLRMLKARMQNRLGSPVWQPFYDVAKLLGKGETVSGVASWVFVWTPRLNLAVALWVALAVPWVGIASLSTFGVPHAADLLLIVYLLALGKFASMLAAMDTGSAFGGLGASREAMISLQAEPILLVGLGALALGAGSTDLAGVYSAPLSPFVAALVGGALVIAALAELSRMPVDDPTTHLELTMVHEALILENSGRNLALTEIAVALRTSVFLGLATQTWLRIWPSYVELALLPRYAVGVLALFGAAAALAVAEGVIVKLNWRRIPNFLAFGLMLSLLAALVAAARG
jgi:formate hydrogenlyase subunit 4